MLVTLSAPPASNAFHNKKASMPSEQAACPTTGVGAFVGLTLGASLGEVEGFCVVGEELGCLGDVGWARDS